MRSNVVFVDEFDLPFEARGPFSVSSVSRAGRSRQVLVSDLGSVRGVGNNDACHRVVALVRNADGGVEVYALESTENIGGTKGPVRPVPIYEAEIRQLPPLVRRRIMRLGYKPSVSRVVTTVPKGRTKHTGVSVG